MLMIKIENCYDQTILFRAHVTRTLGVAYDVLCRKGKITIYAFFWNMIVTLCSIQ